MLGFDWISLGTFHDVLFYAVLIGAVLMILVLAIDARSGAAHRRRVRRNAKNDRWQDQ